MTTCTYSGIGNLTHEAPAVLLFRNVAHYQIACSKTNSTIPSYENYCHMCAGRRPVSPQLIFIVLVVDFCSTSRFYIYIVCVDRTGSLSGSAFNQLRLATLNIVLTILY